MLTLPPEIKSLIAAEVWRLCSPSTWANFSLAWPEMVPFVRERRFKDIDINRLEKMRQLMDIVEGAQDCAAAIQRMKIENSYPHNDTEMIFLIPPLVTRAVNLQTLSLQHLEWKDSIPPSACPSLTMLSLCAISFPRLSDLVDALLSIPNLTNLNIRCLELHDLKALALEMWPTARDQSLESCAPPWDTRGFEAPKAVSQLSCLEIHVLWMSDLMLLDLLSSAKTPFPNLREITLVPCFCPPREAFSGFLQRYPSLRLLYIQCYLCDSYVSNSVSQSYMLTDISEATVVLSEYLLPWRISGSFWIPGWRTELVRRSPLVEGI